MWLYDIGKGSPQDYKIIAELYAEEAEKGSHHSQFTLGNMHALGHGVPQNYKKAAKWYRKAAEQGSVDAQEKLRDMFNEDKKISKEPVK